MTNDNYNGHKSKVISQKSKVISFMIIGHEKQLKALNTLFKKRNIPHAFLFSGPEKVGKRAVAGWFLQMINCSENIPCGKCRNCYEIEKGIHSDIINISPEKKEIQLWQIEELIQRISVKGFKSSFKGAIMDRAHLMNRQAQNSILKTLEEPSSNTVIILVTEYPNMLLPTILSRTFQIKFSLVAENKIAHTLKDLSIASLSSGRPGKALDYLYLPEKKKREEERRKELDCLTGEPLTSRFARAKSAAKEENMEEMLQCWLSYMREKIREKIKKKEETKHLRKIAEEVEELIFLSSKTNINMQLALEKIMIKL